MDRSEHGGQSDIGQSDIGQSDICQTGPWCRVAQVPAPLVRLEACLMGRAGKVSLMEMIADALRDGARTKGLYPDFAEIEENARMFVLRVVHAAFFEWQTGHGRSLPKRCGCRQTSIASIRKALAMERSPRGHAQWNRLQELFRMFEKGNGNLLVPAFGGELYDADKAPLLGLERVFSDRALGEVLDGLCGNDPGEADFAELDPGLLCSVLSRLGTRRLGEAHERLHRLVVRMEEKIFEGVFGDRGLARLKDSERCEILHHVVREKGNACLFCDTGCTTDEFVDELCENADAPWQASTSRELSENEAAVGRLVARALARKGRGASILDVRVLDLACQTPWTLCLVLEALARVGARHFDRDARLRAAIARERARLVRACQRLGLETVEVPMDEMALLFRVLVRCLHAVCKSSWLRLTASLALWVKCTAYGLPLPLLGLRLRVGARLSTRGPRELDDKLSRTREGRELSATLHRTYFALETLQGRLAGMGDGSMAEVEEARRLFERTVLPMERELCLAQDVDAMHGTGVVPALDELQGARFSAFLCEVVNAASNDVSNDMPNDMPKDIPNDVEEPAAGLRSVFSRGRGTTCARLRRNVLEQAGRLCFAHPEIVFAHAMSEGGESGFDIVFMDIGGRGHVDMSTARDEIRRAIDLAACDGTLCCRVFGGRPRLSGMDLEELGRALGKPVRVKESGRTSRGAFGNDVSVPLAGAFGVCGNRTWRVFEIERLGARSRRPASRPHAAPGIGSLGHLLSWQNRPGCVNAPA